MTNCIHDHAEWGPGDQLGAGNRLTAESTLAALAMAKTGRVVDLSHVIENGAPRIEPNQTPYLITSSATSRNTLRYRAGLGATNEVGANLERMELTMHVGTHIDALGHFTIGDRMYGGYSADQTVGDWGLANLGVEQIPPIITRGVCLDLSDLDGGDPLPAGRAITADDVRRHCDGRSIELRPGDAVFINTGWGRLFMTDNATYVSGEPGIEEGAAHWLTEQGVLAIGADNMAVEVLPGTRHPEIMMPVHQHCLVEAGVYLVENLVLDELIAAGADAFCLVMLPVKFKGATGCPVRPVAIL
ncbi:MAG: cyclase family protein [Alphaproteobacteria bacterium]|jgi:kynurenine formamidase|nr:cyclase family protein [Alphaproteobacteria bacterium]MDP6563365.1 cyclase family protein [Alphaproteobacteria bacterium]MDP6812153.1 cyclase family protein [Alphaproteobacteria bacterium]